jgi:sulfite reductase (NADPH) flavoprotein alpha-component
MLQALKVENSPFSERQVEALKQSFGHLDNQQSAWLSGYLAGSMAGGVIPLQHLGGGQENFATPGVTSASRPASSGMLNIFYGSQTGNGEIVANTLAVLAAESGLNTPVQSLNEFRPAALKKLEYAVFIMSTHGEGDPPDDAIELFDFLRSGRAPRLEGLQFCVLALGDRSYEKFCESGRELESLLLAQGARAFSERVECDVEYESQAKTWSEQVLEWGKRNLVAGTRESSRSGPGDLGAIEARALENRRHEGDSQSLMSVVPSTSAWKRSRPFPSVVQKVQKITGLESTRDVYHIELSLEHSGLTYEPGDALGVWASNDAELVERVLRLLDIDPSTRVVLDGQRRSVRDLLTKHREITRLSVNTVEQYAKLAGDERLTELVDGMNEDQLREFTEARQFIDLVEDYPPAVTGAVSATGLTDLLKPLSPRSYSIASAQSFVDDEVHLTVVTRTSNAMGAERLGVASQMLNHRVQPGDEVGVFIEPNRRFRLPEDSEVPVIMIGSGTGIAPYRSFLQEMEERDYQGNSWLIFGNPNQRTDFLYQREWLKWRESGLLNRIDVAFSRDQDEKHYVQHVIREHAGRFTEWLERGAVIYVCGCIDMGHDVENAIGEVLALAQPGGRNQDGSMGPDAFIADLRRQRRLLKDLY